MSFVDAIVGWANDVGWELGSVVLALCSIIEYVFPPFPGDTVTIVGAVLIPTAGWPLFAVWIATVTGSTIGAMFNWYVGRWFVNHPSGDTWLHRFLSRPKIDQRIQAVVAQFERRGSWFLIINRFVPAFRTVFFVAAGMAKLPWLQVAFYSAVSATLFNGMLLGIGVWVGFEIEPLVDIVSTYSEVVLLAIFLLFIIWLFKPKQVEIEKDPKARD